MTDEELNKARECFIDLIKYEFAVTESKTALELLTAEQNRRAVRSEDVQRAIGYFKNHNETLLYKAIKHNLKHEGRFEKECKTIASYESLAITALEAYAPKEIFNYPINYGEDRK